MPRVSAEKNREYQRKWYKKNRTLQIERNAANKQRKKDWYSEYKKTLCCEQCSESHPATLDFHHKESKKKIATVSSMVLRNWSLEKIIVEIRKCDVLCANCHRKHHYNDGARPNGEAPGL